jgi:hypothetical protein
MSNNEVEGEIIEHACEWDDHAIVIWDYEWPNVIYFPSQEKGQYEADFF